MTIRPGVAWGTPYDGPDPIEIHDDATLASALAQEPGAGPSVSPTVWVRGGDLHRSLGAPGRSTDRRALPLDLGFVRLDGGDERPFAAHVVARRRGWRGRFLVILNAAYLGDWNVGPRAHPNDGRLDVIDGALTIGQRLQARRRVGSGSHLPHPALAASRVTSGSWDLGRSVPVWIDGRRAGPAQRIEVRIEPDAGTVVA